VSDAPPPGGYPQQPPPGGYQQPPQQPAYQPPPAAPQAPGGYQQPPGGYQQAPQQFQPVNPPPAKSGNGCLKAFLIVTAICVVLGVITFVALFFVVGKAIDDVAKSFGVANTNDYEIKQPIDCSVSDFGTMKASGTIINKKSGRQAYQVKVDFIDADTKIKLGDGLDFTKELSKDQTGTWSATGSTTSGSSIDSSKKINCTVSEVSYSIFSCFS